jgi:formate-dependent nitrite reductase cytochrome c552 subunit
MKTEKARPTGGKEVRQTGSLGLAHSERYIHQNCYQGDHMMMKRCIIVLAAVALVMSVAGPAQALNEECAECHDERVNDLGVSSHSGLVCETCHEGAAAHGGGMGTKTTVHFDLEVCSGCHPDQYGTYIYGDDWKTKYGGSPGPHAVNPLPNGDPVLWDKLLDFANYNDIIDGYGFTREYNEERSHNVMIKDHHDVLRGKKDTCLQCKSTKLAYYWDTGPEREHEIQNTTTVQAGHMTYPVDITKGTLVSMYTDRDPAALYPHEVKLVVKLQGGSTYASFAGYPGADYSDPTKTGYVLWSALYALTINELPPGSPTIDSGNGCNHCHDPHKAGQDADGNTIGFRLIRKSLIYAIENNGINPYADNLTYTFNGDTALTMDEGIALCAQCHVEYVCGNSPIDKIDRDFFSWAKAADLEDVYSTNFPGLPEPCDPLDPTCGRKYIQDWIHGTGGLSSPNNPPGTVPYNTPFPIEEELIKSQHPEAETYWGSRHYGNDAPCFLCHMPKVTSTTKVDENGDPLIFTSHWLASPNKYMEPEPAGAFAAAFGVELDREGIISPCGECHGGKLSRMKTKAEGKQDDVYADALVVQTALVDSLAAIKAAKDADAAGEDVDMVLLDGPEGATEDHRAAHVRWENLVVSENSMGFHNPSEVGDQLGVALGFAQSARQKAEDAWGAPCVPEPDGEGPPGDPNCSDGIDNDCDGFTDAADPDCQEVGECSDYTNKGDCNMDSNCEWQGSPKSGTCVGVTPCEPSGAEICTGGIDEDCNGLVDCDDPACDGDPVCAVCSDYTDEATCLAEGCRWNSKKQTCR